MTDLLEHTEWVSRNGLLSSIPLEEAGRHADVQVARIHSAAPHFSWQLCQGMQSAFRIQLASEARLLAAGTPDLWDSGKVPGATNTGIAYAGKPLQPGRCYYWRVCVWDGEGEQSAFSDIKKFLTAPSFSAAMPRYPLQKEARHPQALTRTDSGYFMDFGKDAFGQILLTLASDKDTDTVSIHLGEAREGRAVARKPGGTVRHTCYRLPLRRGTHSYQIHLEPDGRNTNPNANESGVRPILMPDYIGEVYPFRYCEVEGYEGPLQASDATRLAVHYPFDRAAAHFECSDTVLNQVWELCKHSIEATTFCGVYVDGDRERIPYEADAYINQLSHYATDLDFSLARFSADYLMDWPTWPSEWIMQSVLMPWNDYMHTGDTTLLRRRYDEMKAHTMAALRDSTGLISTRTGLQTPEFLRSIGFRGKTLRDIVDWPQSGAAGLGKAEAGEADGYDMRPHNTVVNAYHYRTLVVMEHTARALGHEAEAEQYAREAGAFARTFNHLLYDSHHRAYRDAPDSRHHSLHANMFALAFGLVPQSRVEHVCRHIQSRGMACSVYGAQFLLSALFDAGMDHYALSLLCATGQRSWYNMIRLGSTITLEAWDPAYKPNLDWNHAWGAAPANLIARYVAGVQPIEPGFRRMRVKPHPGALAHVSAVVPTIQGETRVTYQQQEGEWFCMDVVVPPNCQAEVWMPRYGRSTRLTIDGQEVRARAEDSHLVLTIGPGPHRLTSKK